MTQRWDANGNPLPAQQVWDEHGNLISDGGRRPPSGYSPAFGGFAKTEQGLTLGAGDELQGAGAVVHDLPTLIARSTPQNFGANVASTFHDAAQQFRDSADYYGATHPISGPLLEGSGMALPVALSGGAAMGPTLERQAAARAPGLLGQMARGAATGALVGGAGGFASGDGDLNQRFASADQGAAGGAAVGLLAPPVVGAAGAGVRFAGSLLDRLPPIAERAQSGTGAFGAQLFSGGGRRPPPRPPMRPDAIPEPTMNAISRLADRMRMNPDDVERAFAEAQRNPQGQVTADLFEDPGVRMLRPIAQAPGQTGQLATRVATQRFQAATDRIIDSLRRNLSVSESRQAAIRRLEGQYNAASANLYQPLWRRPLSGEQTQAMENTLKPYADDDVFKDASRRAQRIFNRDVANGVVQGDINDNFSRYLHYLKMGLDDAAKFAATPQGGAMSTELRGIRTMRANILAAMDQNIPGYAEARARWGSLANAEDALDEGAGFLSMNSDEVAARMGEMTPFEREHARIGMADAISHAVGRSGKVVGNANVANSQLLNSPEGQQRLRAVFETPEQAADFLDTVTSQNRLMRNAGQWGTGSPTYSNEEHGADNIMSALGESAVHAARGDMGRAISRTGRQIGNLVSNNQIERTNNIVGADLLRRVDTPDAASFARQVVEELRRRDQARATGATIGRIAGAAGGAAARGRRP